MPASGKRPTPDHVSPPKATEKRKKRNQSATCIICDVIIIESTDDVIGEDAVYCEGDCQAWMHRKCVCMSKKLYDKLSNCDDPFYCSYCVASKQSQEISALRNLVDDLTKKLAGMKALEHRIADLEKNFSKVKTTATISSAPSSGSSSAIPVTNIATNHPSSLGALTDRKFNLVIQGIPECPSSLKRFERLQQDQQNVLKVLSNLDSSINLSSVKDNFRLGQFKKDVIRPRPILVKLLRSGDVQSILSKRGSLQAPISIKPDMTTEERDNEKILLNQRWLLIQKGINRKQIKIRGINIFVNNKLYGRLSQGQFHLSENPSSLDNPNPMASSATTQETPSQ